MKEEPIARVRYLLEHPKPIVDGLNAALSDPKYFPEGTRLEELGEILALAKADLAPQRQKRQLNQRKRIVPVSDRHEEYRDKRVIWFRLGDRIHKVNSWPEMIHDLCIILARENPHEFSRVKDYISGPRGRVYISDNPQQDGLTRWKPINGTQLHVEVNLDGYNAKKFADYLSDYFGYGKEIEVSCE